MKNDAQECNENVQDSMGGGAQELVWRLKRGPVVKEMVPEGRGHGIQSPKNGGDASRIAAVQRVKA